MFLTGDESGMKERYWSGLLALLLLIVSLDGYRESAGFTERSITSCSSGTATEQLSFSSHDSMYIEPVLEIDGVKYYDDQIMLEWYDEYFTNANLPFTVVLEGLGFQVNWIDDNQAVIRIHGEHYTDANYYILSLEEKTLFRMGTEFTRLNNVLVFPPGTRVHYCRAGDREVYVSSEMLSTTLLLMGIWIQIGINLEKKHVLVYREIHFSRKRQRQWGLLGVIFDPGTKTLLSV